MNIGRFLLRFSLTFGYKKPPALPAAKNTPSKIQKVSKNDVKPKESHGKEEEIISQGS